MTVYGVDISHHNAMPDISTYDFVFLKATQGATFVDSTYAVRWEALRKAGKVRGAYHFMSMGDSAPAQVDHFVAIANIHPGDIVVLDFENDDTWQFYTTAQIAAMGNAIMGMLRQAYPDNRVILYCNRTDAKRGVGVQDGLWIASPGVTPTMPYVFWQYGGESTLDLDRGNFDTIDDLREWANMATSNPWVLPSGVLKEDGTPYSYGELLEYCDRFISEFRDTVFPDIEGKLDALTVKVDALAGLKGTFTITGSGSVGG